MLLETGPDKWRALSQFKCTYALGTLLNIIEILCQEQSSLTAVKPISLDSSNTQTHF